MMHTSQFIIAPIREAGEAGGVGVASTINGTNLSSMGIVIALSGSVL